MSTLIELELESETPVFLGSYDTQFHEWDAFRTQSLKGLWRWWLRAYVAGILYEKGLLSWRPGKDTLAQLDRKSLDLLSSLVGNLLGSTTEASKFRITANISNVHRPYICPHFHSTECNTPRVRLLTLGRRQATYTTRLVVNLKIEERFRGFSKNLSSDEIFVAIGSLVTGLVLDGIGKMSRRGFGTFKIKICRDNANIFRAYVKRDRTFDLDKLRDFINEVKKHCEDYVSRSKHTGSTQQVTDLPPLDLISNKVANVANIKLDFDNFSQPQILAEGKVPIFTVYEVTWSGKRIIDVVWELQDFFYRPGRVKRFYGSPNTPYGHWQDFITKNKYAWFFGLPREQRGTGYRTRVSRRASPIHLAVHRDKAFLTAFLSLDWPAEMRWIGAGSMTISLNRDLIARAYVEILAYLEAYLRKLGYKYRVVYP